MASRSSLHHHAQAEASSLPPCSAPLLLLNISLFLLPLQSLRFLIATSFFLILPIFLLFHVSWDWTRARPFLGLANSFRLSNGIKLLFFARRVSCCGRYDIGENEREKAKKMISKRRNEADALLAVAAVSARVATAKRDLRWSSRLCEAKLSGNMKRSMVSMGWLSSGAASAKLSVRARKGQRRHKRGTNCLGDSDRRS